MDELYIRVMTPIVPESVDAILRLVDEQLSHGGKRIHLLLSTPGGSVAQGISLSNYLRGVPIEVYSYNFGAVDSIGVSVYCAASRRFCCPQSRFLIHRINLVLRDSQSIDELFLARKSKEIEVDTNNVAALICAATNMSVEEVVEAMREQTILDAEKALACGLVHEIKTDLMPANASFAVISPDYNVIRYGDDAKR